MTKLPFVLNASPNAREPIQGALKSIAQTLQGLRDLLSSEGLYAPDGTLGIDDGKTAVHFYKDRIEVLDTSEEIPF